MLFFIMLSIYWGLTEVMAKLLIILMCPEFIEG